MHINKFPRTTKVISFILFALIALNTIDLSAQGTPSILQKKERPTPLACSVDFHFYENVRYGESIRNVFDIFLPAHDTPTPLVIFFHGGSFSSGDKSVVYERRAMQRNIDGLLENKIAFATVNYRFLESDDEVGLLRCLHDTKRAVQFIKYHADEMNIDKGQVILMGSSAGAGASLWIGLQDDMAIANDPTWQGESTRVQGIIATATQCSYDFLRWQDLAFYSLKSRGFGAQEIRKMLGDRRLMTFYGLENAVQLDQEVAKEYGHSLDMLRFISPGDPELYVANKIESGIPKNNSHLLHHPLHAKALLDRAREADVNISAYIPALDIDTTHGETVLDFALRKFKEK